MIYFLDGNQEVIKIVRSEAVISAIQTQELPEDNSLLRDYLSVRLKNHERLFNAQYMAVKSYGGNRNAFDLYRIASELVPDNATEFMGVQVAPYELEGVVIEDLRPQNRPLSQTMSQVLEGSDWRLGYVADNLPNVTANFYYVSVKDALKKIQELLNVEMLFKVEISGNKITDKWVEVYHQLGNRTMKRFNYGTNALSVVRESSHDELYTALIGRGKGEEVGETESGDATYGRKINFADVEWEKSAGEPVDKPKGQKYIELPSATAEYGIKLIDGRKVPRIGIVEFSETDDPEKLIQETYQELLVRARPKVLFKASVINTGDMLIGDTVTIHRHDLDFHYQARVRKVVRDRKNNNKTQVEIGDVVHTASTKRQGQINSALNNVANDLENVRGEITEARSSADGKNTNFYGNVEPNRKKVGDTWFRDHPSLTGESQILVWNGEVWELIMDTSETTKNADAIAEQQQDIEEAKQTADEAVGQINTAVANAGFTSLDDTLQNMNYITMDAEQRAQEAITDASNAYGLAQTSISEAQTAQANSLSALGKADNALDGVSSLNVRVDEVESELTMKADNTFMNEDGTLTTLSNAITFNAHRFSSDMSRIESRVESLAGEINLVILRDAFEGKALGAGDTFPNPSLVRGAESTMREMIKVVPGETLALTKETVAGGSNVLRINFYDSDSNYAGLRHINSNEELLTIPSNVHYIWVSYTTGSKPQIVRGEHFIPYRPNIADQMTADEVTVFRNEYDEFADKTERRMTAIDSSGGRLDTAELLITQTADGLDLKADQTTVNELTGEVESLGTEFDIVAGQVSSRVWNTDIQTAVDGIEVGGRNYWAIAKEPWRSYLTHQGDGLFTNNTTTSSFAIFRMDKLGVPVGETYTVSFEINISDDAIQFENDSLYINGWGTGRSTKHNRPTLVKDKWVKVYATFNYTVENTESVHIYIDGIPAIDTFQIRNFQLEKGNIVTDWTPAPEDTDAKISHIETEWTQTFDAFSQTVSDIDGRVTSQKQTIDSIVTEVYEPDGRLSKVEQTANGLQSEVYNADGSSKVTQLANGLSSVVTDFSNLEIGGRNLLRNSGVPVTTSRYNIQDYVLTENLKEGTEVTLSIKGELGLGKTHFGAYNSGGNTSLGVSMREKNEYGVYTATFRWTEDSINEFLRIYHMPNSVVNSSTIEWVKLEKANKATDWTPAPEDMATTSQITQLSDNINLRVSKGDVISQINIEAERTLIQSDKLLLDANNVVFTGKAWIPSSVIGDLEADQITSGTLDAGQITVVNLDVNSLTGNTAEFVKAAFNSISSTTSIDGNGISIFRADGSRSARLGIHGYEFWLGGVEHGTIGVRSYTGTNPLYLNKNSISLYARKDSYLSLTYQGDRVSTGGGYIALSILGDTGDININSKLNMFGTINMNGRNTLNSNDIQFGSNDIVMGRIFPVTATKELQIRGADLLRFVVGENAKMIMKNGGDTTVQTHIDMSGYSIKNVQVLSFTDGNASVSRHSQSNIQVVTHGTGAVLFGQTTAQFYRDINMNGYTITGQSDYRLKRDIDDTELNSLASIESWKIVDFNWIDDELNKRNGRQLGLIAQDTPDLAVYDDETDTWNINSSKQIMMNTHAIQQLALIEQNTNKVASQALQATETNEEKIKRLEKRIEELESVM